MNWRGLNRSTIFSCGDLDVGTSSSLSRSPRNLSGSSSLVQSSVPRASLSCEECLSELTNVTVSCEAASCFAKWRKGMACPGADMGTHRRVESSKEVRTRMQIVYFMLYCTLFLISVSSNCEPRLGELYPEPGSMY
jgi:hypothetical protein